MLTSTSFCDNFLFTHAFGKPNLSQGIVNLVGSCMVKVFPFEINLGSADMLGQVFCVIKRSFTSYVLAQKLV
ncbi:Uncharacterised protein [Mycobacterium tuberculosis]|nr:Uncharacterised protein [Mycobacterium tuberculosis]